MEPTVSMRLFIKPEVLLGLLDGSLSGCGYCGEINWIPEPPYLTVKSGDIFLMIPGTPPLPGDLLCRELVLANPAQGAFKIRGQVRELRAGSNAVLGIARCLIINPTAYIANILHNKTLLQFYIGSYRIPEYDFRSPPSTGRGGCSRHRPPQACRHRSEQR